MNKALLIFSIFISSSLIGSSDTRRTVKVKRDDKVAKMDAAYRILVEAYDNVFSVMSSLSSSGFKISDLHQFREEMALHGYPCNDCGTLWSRVVADKSLEFIVEGKFSQIDGLAHSLPLPPESDLVSLKKKSLFERLFGKKDK